MSYSDYNFKEKTKKFIENIGFVEPTPIQKAVIPMALKGKSIVGISDTGTGKTHAFLIPLMEMINSTINEVQAVITAPTRELAQQIYNRAKEMSETDSDLRVRLITGGINRDKMVESIKKQPHIVIGTPGRIKDLFLNQEVLRLDTAKTLIIDEADMTLEYGFLDDVDAFAGRMKEDLQMMVFSATIPQALRPFLKKYMQAPQTIKIEGEFHNSPKIEHVLIPCKHHDYGERLLDILPGFQPYICLIFANTREEAKKTASLLRKNGYDLVEIHGGLEARERKQAMRRLQNLECPYVVATDIAARGLDIEGVSHVISLGFPSELDFYKHRSGRTGRNGNSGVCFALYKDDDEKSINHLKEQGIVFEHRNFRNGQWTNLKPFGQKRISKNDLHEKELAKRLTKKDQRVKPGYKKKRAAAIEKIKRKERREMIAGKIKEQRIERYKAQQRMKRYGESEE